MEVYKDDDDTENKKYYSVWQGGKFYKNNAPHIGFSAYGVKDKDHSLFNRDERYGIELDTDEIHAFDNEFKSYIDDAYKNKTKYKDYYNYDDFYETNDFDWLTDNNMLMREKLRIMSKLGDRTDAVVLSPYYYNFDTDSNFDNLVRILNFQNNYGGNNVVLAAAPENSIIKWQDVLKNKYTAQRDTPHEIVTTKITPVKQFSNKEFNELIDFYKLIRKSGATGQEAFYDTFELNPYTLVSDANLKQIMMDMSNSLPVNLGNIARCVGRCY